MSYIHIWAWRSNADGSDGRDANEVALEDLKKVFSSFFPNEPIDGALGGEVRDYDHSFEVHIYVEHDHETGPITVPEWRDLKQALEEAYKKRFPHLDAEAFIR